MPGWARLQLQRTDATRRVVECAPVSRYFAQAQPNETFVVCRLSYVALIATHLSFQGKAAGPAKEAETTPRSDGVPERLNAWAIVGSHKCRLRVQGRWRGAQGMGTVACIACRRTIIYVCWHGLARWRWRWRCDLPAPWACLYLNFEARIRGIQVVPENAGAVHSVWVTSWWCRKWHKS